MAARRKSKKKIGNAAINLLCAVLCRNFFIIRYYI